MVLSSAPRALALEAHVGTAKIYSARAPFQDLKMAFYLSQLCFYNHPNQMTIMPVKKQSTLWLPDSQDHSLNFEDSRLPQKSPHAFLAV